MLSVKVTKIQKFIHKRLDESFQSQVAINDIEVLHNTTKLNPSDDLSALQDEMVKESDQIMLHLNYRSSPSS